MQKSQLVQTAITTFQMTQAEAGKLIGITSQSAVSHLLALLKLPPEIQAHVASGAIPQRIARSLVALAKHARTIRS